MQINNHKKFHIQIKNNIMFTTKTFQTIYSFAKKFFKQKLIL